MKQQAALAAGYLTGTPADRGNGHTHVLPHLGGIDELADDALFIKGCSPVHHPDGNSDVGAERKKLFR